MIRLIFLVTMIMMFLSFSSDKIIEFTYPKNEKATIIMSTDIFKEFKKEWRGKDYYFLSENGENDITCSVLFYKLNKKEQKLMVEPFDRKGGSTSPILPFAYFLESNLKQYEVNNTNWGEYTDDFMFRQNDIRQFQGIKAKQKHMYAYCMFDKNLFVNIHLSKNNCTPQDSTLMRQILSGLKKKK